MFIRIIILSLISSSIVLKGETITSKIIDKKTNEPLVFANIMVKNVQKGTSSTGNGVFVLSIDEAILDSTLVISHVGYETKSLKIRDIKDCVALEPIDYSLSEVVVRAPHRRSKGIVLNKFQKSECMLRYSSLPFGGGNYYIPVKPDEPQIETIFFPCDSSLQNKRLLNVKLYFNNLQDTLSIIRIRIFDADQNGFPKNDILNQSLIVEIKGDRENMVEVDLGNYDLSMPDRGLFVGYESLMAPENISTLEDMLGNAVNVTVPHLYLIPLETRMRYFFYSEGRWLKSKPWYVGANGEWLMVEDANAIKNGRKVYSFTPAISLELSK